MSYTLGDYVVQVYKCIFGMIVALYAFGKWKYCQ